METFLLVRQGATAMQTDALQGPVNAIHEQDVVHWFGQLNVSKMSRTFGVDVSTRGTFPPLTRPHTSIVHAPIGRIGRGTRSRYRASNDRVAFNVVGPPHFEGNPTNGHF